MKKDFHLKYTTKRKLNGFLYVLPFIIGFFICFAIPLFNTVKYSFNTVSVNDAGGMNLDFSGFKNYINLFTTEVTTQAQPVIRLFADQNIYILTNFPLIVIFSLFMALLANMKFKGRGIVRVIFFMPIIFGLEIVTDMLAITTGGEWAQQSSGLFSQSIISDMLRFYTNIPRSILMPVISYIDRIFDVISQSGVQTLIYLAGLQSISPSLYEVAKIEGATAYETFWKVTIPSIIHITLFVAIFTIVDLFLKSPISEEAYNFAFTESKIGIGSSLSVIYIINVILVLGLLMLILRKVVKRYEK
jgi:ABC-type sugar transport system permease subunit